MRAAIIRMALVLMPRAAVTMTGAGYAVDHTSSFIDLRGDLPVHPSAVYAAREVSKIQGAIIHHSATKGQTIRSIAQFHTEVRQWPGVAYHFAIGYDGVIYQLQDVETVTYHAQGHNARTIGIVLIGNFQDRPLPEKMETSLVNLLAYLEEVYGLKYIWLHGQTKATLCPGKYARDFAEPYLKGLEYLPVRK